MSKVREYEHVPSPEVLGAPVQHCTKCGKRLAPHAPFPVRDTDGAWTCVVCPSSIAARTFVAPMLDPSVGGVVRDVTIEVHSRSLLVRVSPGRFGGVDAPHHRAADFTEQRPAIVAAFSEVATEIANAASVGVDKGFTAGVQGGAKAERERVERILARHFDNPKPGRTSEQTNRAILADIRSGATS